VIGHQQDIKPRWESSPPHSVAEGTVARAASDRRLVDIHCFRGLAILFIVAGHCCSFFAWTMHGQAEAFTRDLFDDSTLFFVFIAGFLFQTTERHFSYPDYLARKLRNVGAPYLVAIAPAIAYALLRGGHSLDAEALHQLSSAEKMGYLLLYGGSTINHALWFIPVIALYYLASPILIAVDRQKHAYLGLLLLFPLSLWMHRPTYTHGHNLSLGLYFLSAFVLGMCCSRFRVPVLGWLDRHLGAVVVLGAGIVLGHFLASDHHGKYSMAEPFDPLHPAGLIDWLFLQKTVMAFALLGLIRRYRAQVSGALGFLGDRSFTIYFFHFYVIFLAHWLTHFAAIEIAWAIYLPLLVSAVLLPCGLSLAAQVLFPRWSRSLVGS
jgi:probable poly-beta-1,6-N-acetyl-D-glucosamine export protein